VADDRRVPVHRILLVCAVMSLALEASRPVLPAAHAQPVRSARHGAKQQPAHVSSDAEIVRKIIEESIASYPGNCPCPYNVARNGSRCGGRSAYSREAGEAPLCYARDVTSEMVTAWREQHAL
jgi:hypothetical protein